jgi:murein DD-endopeptidase MepM/ murein hydrolase activator NlpD
MAQTLLERAWTWLHATFPERQIYIRSEGRVQFFTCGSTLQATCAGLSLIFLGWVAFASVNVIFKDHIIAAKEHRYQQMQGTYENRIADLQLSYDELNDALVSAEDRFKATADEVEAKQRSVSALLGHNDLFSANFMATNGSGSSKQIPGEAIPVAVASGGGAASDSLGSEATPPPPSSGYAIPAPQPSPSFGSGASDLSIMPEPVEPQPRTARPSKASFLDDSLFRLIGNLFAPSLPQTSPDIARNPGLADLAQQTSRVAQLGRTETALLVSLDRRIGGDAETVQGELGRLGVATNADGRTRGEDAAGGPFVPLDQVQVKGVSDTVFATTYADAIANASKLEALVTALRHVPLTTPVHGAKFELTSGYGPRIDPFTGRVGFHTGVDFAGPWGSPVSATAPGIVVFAGNRGGYGNMVEIDHGYGFHTRYGHLSAVLARPGALVQRGTIIGRLGSTGRSTGPHVHYEIWLADSLKDPSRYIEAGRKIAE